MRGSNVGETGFTRDDMLALGTRHVVAESTGDLEGLMATLVAEPVYEFHPVGLRMRGGARVRRFYTQFFSHFVPMRHDYALLGEWVSETSVAQEYEIALKVSGKVETHRVLGILYASGNLLGGERVYASERFVELMTGELFRELEPLSG